MRHAFLGFFSPTMRVRAGFYPPQVPSRGFARSSVPSLCPILRLGFADVAIRTAWSVTLCSFETKVPVPFRGQNHSILQHVQGSSVARTPSSRLACTPVGLVSSRRHPWGFPFRGLTSSGAGRPCRSAMPFFSLAGRVVVMAVVCLAAPGGRSDGSSVFRPIAPGCRSSPLRGPPQLALAGRLVLLRGALSSCEAQSRVPVRSGAASRATGHSQIRWQVPDRPGFPGCPGRSDRKGHCARSWATFAGSSRFLSDFAGPASSRPLRWVRAVLFRPAMLPRFGRFARSPPGVRWSAAATAALPPPPIARRSAWCTMLLPTLHRQRGGSLRRPSRAFGSNRPVARSMRHLSPWPVGQNGVASLPLSTRGVPGLFR